MKLPKGVPARFARKRCPHCSLNLRVAKIPNRGLVWAHERGMGGRCRDGRATTEKGGSK